MKKKTYLTRTNKRSSKNRIKITFWLFFCLFAVIGISALLLNPPNSFSLPELKLPGQTNSGQSSIESSQDIQQADDKIDLNSWNMSLVNYDHPLNASFVPQTMELPNGIEVDKRIYASLTQMIADAKEKDLYLVVCSGYRPYTLQSELFEEQIQMEMGNGYTKEEATTRAATTVAIPGTSEHQTGLAVDIVALDYQLLDEKVMETDEVKWLYANCHKYGFIVRYPEGKSDITKIIYEPWHYRYVGVEAATAIMQNQLTLEEFIAEQQT